MANPGQQPIGPEQILAMLWRRRWLALTLFLVPFSAVATAILVLPDVYEASATILAERQQVPEEFVRSTVTSEVERRVHMISQTIMSRSELTKLIDRFGLYPELRKTETPDEVVRRMREDIEVDLKHAGEGNQRTTTAFSISYRGQDAEKVARVANEIASRYIDEDLKLRERQASGTTEFLETQLHDDLRGKLEDLEKKVRSFKEAHMGELPQQETANLATLERLNGQLLLNAEKQARVREQIGILEQLVSPEEASATSAPDAMRARIASLKRTLRELRKRYTDRYPDVVVLKEQIEQLEKQLAAGDLDAVAGAALSGPDVTSQVHSLRAARVELRALQAEEKNLRKAIADYQSRVENTPRREQEFQALKRDYETTQEIYQSLLKRYQEAKLAQSLEHHQKGEQFRLLDPAVIPREPAGPNRLRLLAVALAAVLGFAGGIVLLRERADTSFRDVEELRAAVRVPFVVSIPKIVTRQDRLWERLRFGFGATALGVAIGSAVGLSWLVARGNVWLTSLVS